MKTYASKYSEIRPIWGNKDQIMLVREYDQIRNGLKLVKYIRKFDAAHDEDCEEFGYEKAVIECPFCFIPHEIIVDTDLSKPEFALDSQYCLFCQTEFIFNPESEFEILVKQEPEA